MEEAITREIILYFPKQKTGFAAQT